MKVEIDGVLYVPVTEASPHAEAIARAIAGVFWGETGHMPLAEALEDLRVVVSDDGGSDGEPIQNVVASILQQLSGNRGSQP